METKKELKWLLAISRTNFEKKAAELLKSRIIDKNKSELFGEIVVPEVEVRKTINGKTRIMKKKLFPGYILIQAVPSVEVASFIKNTTHITSVMSNSQMLPHVLSEDEVKKMRQIKDENLALNHSFKVGDQVKIIEGPFKTFVGKIEKIDKMKVIVNVSIFGRSTPVELTIDEIA